MVRDNRIFSRKGKLKGEKKIAIRLWLTGPILAILVISVLAIASIFLQLSFKNSSFIFEEIQSHMEGEVRLNIEEKLNIAEQLNNINYDMFKSGFLDIGVREGREKYFTNILRSYPDAAMSFIGLEDGSFYGARRNLDGGIYVARNDRTTEGASFYYSINDLGLARKLEEKYPNFDPRTRAWYKAAIEEGGEAYSDIYIHFVFQEPTITASKPIYDEDNRLIGVFGVNYLLSWVNELLEQLLIGENGEIFISDNEGRLISTTIDMETHSINGDSLTLININETENDYIVKTVEKLKDKDFKKNPSVKIDGKRYNVGLIDLRKRNLKWNLYFLVAEDDFIKDIKSYILYTLVFLSLLVILLVLVINWISKQITRPIEDISRASESLSKGELNEIDNKNKIEELYSLTNSFNKMSTRLSNMVSGLEKEISRRTYQLESTNKELEELSFKDGLTGISNRRKFDNYYHYAWDKAKDHGKSLGLLMIDIDFFKKYNDTYGHLKGDECLKTIANSLEKNLRRSNDLLARYGGEEFVVLIQETREDDLENLAERIRKDIEKLEIEHSFSEFKFVTISIGLTTMTPREGVNPQQLIENSDIALYKAKRAGRNTVYKLTNNGK